MSPADVLALLKRLTKNPYTDTYEKMSIYELSGWKYVFEASIAMGVSSREKTLRLRAVERALKGRENPQDQHAA